MFRDDDDEEMEEEEGEVNEKIKEEVDPDLLRGTFPLPSTFDY